MSSSKEDKKDEPPKQTCQMLFFENEEETNIYLKKVQGTITAMTYMNGCGYMKSGFVLAIVGNHK